MKTITTQLFSYELDVIKPSLFDPVTHPYNGLRSTRAPVINLFCRSLNDYVRPSVMIRVHGFYPYFFVYVPAGMSPEALIPHFARYLELAFLNHLPQVVHYITCVVHYIFVVRGTAFLGFHSPTYFLKVFVTEWNLVKLAAKMVRSGRCGHAYYVFETHIADFFKFVVDGNISCDRLILQAFPTAKRQSSCDYEFDASWVSFEHNRGEVDAARNRKTEDFEVLSYEYHFRYRAEHIGQIFSQSSTYMSDAIDYIAQFSDLEEDTYQQPAVGKNGSKSGPPTMSASLYQVNFDGGEDPIWNYSDDEEQSFSLQCDIEEPENDSLQRLRYSNLTDIPNVVFQWAGKDYFFNRETGVLSSERVADVAQKPEERAAHPFVKNAESETQASVGRKPTNSNEALIDYYLRYSQNEQYSQIDFLRVMHLEYSEFFDVVYYVFYGTDDLYTLTNGKIDIAQRLQFGVINFDEFYHFDESDVFKALDSVPGFSSANFYDYKALSKKEALTKYLPYVIQQIDPDIVLSWKLEYSGVARIATEAAQFNFDFLTAIGRMPLRASSWFYKIVTTFDAYEYLAQNSPWYNKFSTNKIFSGRVYLGVWNISKWQCKATDSAIQYFDKLLNKCENCIPDLEFLVRLFHDPKTEKKCEDGAIDFFGVVPLGDFRLYISDLLRNEFYRVVIEARLIESSGYIVRAYESAKLFQVPFYEATSRGSQFKTESFLFYLARQQDYIVGPSPSNEEVSRMHASEYLPLVMEPCSGYYTSPMLVFDFASLYPSVMAAYNICYCTLLRDFTPQQQLGPHIIQFYKQDFEGITENDLFYSPAGHVFVKSHIRRGVFAQVMENGLSARSYLVKRYNYYQKELEILKQHTATLKKPPDALNRRIEYLLREINKLRSRQIELKYMMNFSYGYTAAAYSGRMPVIEAGDAILQGSREILEYSIKLVEQAFPGLRVVYADTDSLFVDTTQLFGKIKHLTDAQMLLLANAVGQRVLTTINEKMKPPVFVKFERVYFPSILLSKKRYVGRSYNPNVLSEIHNGFARSTIVADSEFLNDVENISTYTIALSQFPCAIDAKGIESIRRDMPGAVQQTIHNIMEVLFSTSDLSAVKYRIVDLLVRVVLRSVESDFIMRNKVHPQQQFTSAPSNYLAPGSSTYFARDEGGEYYCFCICNINNHKSDAARPIADFGEVFCDGSRLRVNLIYYLERYLIPSLQRLLGPCGLNVEDIYYTVMRYICRLPRLEWVLVDFYRLSKYSESVSVPNVDIFNYICKYTQFRPQLFELNCFINYYAFFGKSADFLRHYQANPPPPFASDIRLQRPMRYCICCRVSGILRSKQISICQFCYGHWSNLLHWRYHFHYILWRLARICGQCGGDSCGGENAGRVCRNWRCTVFWEISRVRCIAVQLENAISALESCQ